MYSNFPRLHKGNQRRVIRQGLETETLKVPVQLWLWCLQVIPTTSSMETLGRWKPIARARKMKGKEGASRERIMLSRVWLQKGSIALEGDRNGQLRATAFRFWS